MDALVVLILVVGALDDAGVGGRGEVTARDAHIVAPRAGGTGVENAGAVGGNRIGCATESGGGDERWGRRGVGLEPAVWINPVLVARRGVSLVQIFGAECDAELLIGEGHDLERAGDVVVLRVIPTAITAAVFPRSDDAQRGLLGELLVGIDDDLAFAVGTARVRDRGGNLTEDRILQDVIDDTAGRALAEEQRRRAFDDLDAVGVVHVERGVALSAIAQHRVHLKSAQGELAHGGGTVGGTLHREIIVARARPDETQDIGDALQVGVRDEIGTEDCDAERCPLDLRADAGGRDRVGL